MDEGMVGLTKKQIEQGKNLISTLDKSKLEIKAAFWLYDKKRSSLWKLFLASTSPQLDVKENILTARKTLQQIVQQDQSLTDLGEYIELIPIDHPFIVNIAKTFATGHDIGNISISNTRFDNLFIEALYLYRMELNSQP